MELLTVKDLSFTYPQSAHPAVRALSFGIEAGSFTVLCGATGSGKSTLLRLLKREIAPHGEQSGEILFAAQPIETVSFEHIGFVMQRPDEQIVTDRVYAELAFGLESMGLPQPVIARRVAEMASYFGMEDWFDRDIATLSGGQKQLLNLASVLIMQPDLLLLDEPTAQLDPIAASDFLGTLQKLNRDFSLTIVIAEHRLEELVPMCDRLLVMEQGRLVREGNPRQLAAKLTQQDPLLLSMPASVRLYHAVEAEGDCPLTVQEGRRFLEREYRNDHPALLHQSDPHSEKKALECRDLFFRYERGLPDVLRGFNLTVWENEIMCLLGGNGSGKTTALSCLCGIRKVYSGEIRVFGKRIKEYTGQTLYQNGLTLLAQDVQNMFLCNTVRAELEDAHADPDTLPFSIEHLLDRHPYDLSGGEQQLVALAKVLAAKPRLLLMDEPTKGLDAQTKYAFLKLLGALKKKGLTMLIVTHDVEFAALCADRCALFFRGEIISEGTPSTFFSENSFYTTAASRISRGHFRNAVTVEEVAALCAANGRKEVGACL